VGEETFLSYKKYKTYFFLFFSASKDGHQKAKGKISLRFEVQVIQCEVFFLEMIEPS
jgi:hypothetical protein